MSQSTACCGCAAIVASGRSSLSPWIRDAGLCAAWDRAIGRDMPRNTGTSGVPIHSNTRSVFSTHESRTVLPLTTVAPTSSRSGERAAVMSATASSVPVSTSRMIFVAMRVSVPNPGPVRTARRARG